MENYSALKRNQTFSVGNGYHQDCVCSMTRDDLQRNPKLGQRVNINVKIVPIVTKYQLNKIGPEHHDGGVFRVESG